MIAGVVGMLAAVAEGGADETGTEMGPSGGRVVMGGGTSSKSFIEIVKSMVCFKKVNSSAIH